MAQERIHQVTGAVGDAVRLAVWCNIRLRLGGVRRAAIDGFTGRAYALVGQRFIQLAVTADVCLKLVLPVDLGERVRVTRESDHVRQERVMEEEPAVVGIVVLVHREPDLTHVRRALHPQGRVTDFLDRGQQQADQRTDDGDDHQQFDQSKGTTSFHGVCPVLGVTDRKDCDMSVAR
jgi:hypothetical protein